MATAPTTRFGPHIASQGGIRPRVAEVLADREADVVEEHDRQQRHERPPAAAAMRADAQRHPEDAEYQAGGRDRELLVDLHQEGVRVALGLA